MKKTRLILPHATENEWRWRQYKAYVAICGDYVDYEVIKGKAVKASMTTSNPLPAPAWAEGEAA